MRLFKVHAGQRVRIVSNLIRWVEHQAEQRIAENVIWEGTVTDKYFYYKGAERRLIIDHTVDWPEYGIWQRDVECEIITGELPPKRDLKRRGVLVDE